MFPGQVQRATYYKGNIQKGNYRKLGHIYIYIYNNVHGFKLVHTYF